MLADNLIFLRNIKGLTQEQVAEVIGISRQSYSKWEQGETYPDIDKCDKLAKYYGVTIDSLVHQDNKVNDVKKSVIARKNRIISAMSGQFQSGLPIFKTNRNTNRNF